MEVSVFIVQAHWMEQQQIAQFGGTMDQVAEEV